MIVHDPADAIGSVQQLYDGALYPGRQVETLRNIDRLFPTRTIACGPRAAPLPLGPPIGNVRFTSNGVIYDLYDYLALNRVGGLLILKRGEIRLEHYEFGNGPATRWSSMSVAKSVTATLVGIAIRSGEIDSIDDAVVKYVPSLRGSAYEGVSIRHVLQMSSGVQWNEDYTDPNSDRRRMLEAQASQRPGGVLELLAALPRAAAPGTRWNYSTGETHVLGAILRAAVDRPLADYLSERLWSRIGTEMPANWWLESPGGLEVGGSGIFATLRDYGRFGLFLLGGGCIEGDYLLPDGWFAEASTPKMIGGTLVPYGYMMWPIPAPPGSGRADAFEARGIFGQHIYVNPAEELVVVVWGALPKPTGRAVIVDHDVFAAIAATLRDS